jgi:hypothetical protein
MIFKDEFDRAAPVVDRVNAAIRDNPLAAGLIGAGVAWMLMGGARGFGVMAGATKDAAMGAAGIAGSVAGGASSAAATVGSAVASGLTRTGSATAAGLKSVASDVAGSVASLVPDISAPDTDKAFEAVTDAGQSVGTRINSAAAAGREYGSAIQSRLSESLEKQPLLLGAIGLAIGAGIASTFATTAVENELMGERGTAAREQLQGLAGGVTDRAKQIASDLKDEASRQGLTPDAAKSAAAGIGEKVKAVAGAGRDSVAQRFASSN